MPQVQLAFTPQSQFIKETGSGANGAVWPTLTLQVPPTLYRRRLWIVHNVDPSGGAFSLLATVRFELQGQLIMEIPYAQGNIATNLLPSPIGWSGNGGTSITENMLNVRLGAAAANSFNLWPVDFVAAADKIIFRPISAVNASGTPPIWFFGCMSMNQW